MDSQAEWTQLNYYLVDENYLQNMELELVAGAFFKEGNDSLSQQQIVINETAVRALRFETPLDALGAEIVYQSDSSRKTVIGVVKDYNHQVLLSQIDPLALLFDPSRFSLLVVEYSGTYQAAVQSAEVAWSKVNPAEKVDVRDFEEEIMLFYETIFGDLSHVLGVIAFLAIFISCLGLLGMATYTTETRMKEIAIRKVLGGSDQSLVLLLSRGFLTILLISVVLAVPTAYVINNLWLELIAYHVALDFWGILLGIGILLMLGVLTIGSQTMRAAVANPVENLKE